MPKSFVTACCLAILAAGCNETGHIRTPDQVAQDDLAQVGELCRNYQFMNKKPPQKPEDLGRVRTMGGNGFEAIRSGKVVLLCNATLPDLDEDPGHAETAEILAYQKQVPESGGFVLMLNRTIKSMTAEEFKAAPRPASAKEGTFAVVKKKK